MKKSQVILIADKHGRVTLPGAKAGDIYIYDPEETNHNLTRGRAIIGTPADMLAFASNHFDGRERHAFRAVDNVLDSGSRVPDDEFLLGQ